MGWMDADPVAGVNGVRVLMETEGDSRKDAKARWNGGGRRASVSDRLVSD